MAVAGERKCPFCKQMMVPVRTAKGSLRCSLCANTGVIPKQATPPPEEDIDEETVEEEAIEDEPVEAEESEPELPQLPAPAFAAPPAPPQAWVPLPPAVPAPRGNSVNNYRVVTQPAGCCGDVSASALQSTCNQMASQGYRLVVAYEAMQSSCCCRSKAAVMIFEN